MQTVSLTAVLSLCCHLPSPANEALTDEKESRDMHENRPRHLDWGAQSPTGLIKSMCGGYSH